MHLLFLRLKEIFSSAKENEEVKKVLTSNLSKFKEETLLFLKETFFIML